MTTKSKTQDAAIIWVFSEFLFHLFSFACCRIKFLRSILLIAILIFLSAMTNNQTKYGIIYEKIAMRVDDDERIVNY